MNDNPQKLTSVLSFFLILASVLWGAMTLRDDLQSPRPAPDMPPVQSLPGSQLLTARLWQDPFEQMVTGARAGSAGTSSSTAAPMGTDNDHDSLQTQIANKLGDLTVLGVTLEGTPYPEDAEVRRRLRYAVEVALLTSGLAPDDRNHIGVQRVGAGTSPALIPLSHQRRRRMHEVGANSTAPPITSVAFEWFSSVSTNGPQNVLVLWICEDDLAREPLEKLSKLSGALGIKGREKTAFYFIGPRSSDTLRSMAVSVYGPQVQLKIAERFRILSPEATAPDSFLLSGSQSTSDRKAMAGALQLRLEGSNVFQNWIAPDDQLAEMLVRELTNRCQGTAKSNVIVIVSEADTFFGRAFPPVFTQTIARAGSTLPNASVWRFNYLRGLDGGKPPAHQNESKDNKSAPTPEAAIAQAFEVASDRADGDAQTDYAQRLAAHLRMEDKMLRNNGARILAVGLAGNDPYDKLLLLHALRPKLREAIFFTTDLDARLWVGDERRYSRNLLVATSYPLEWEAKAGELPLPFRDVYQSAVFAATGAAIKQSHGYTNGPDPQCLQGYLFEIGRHGPVQLEPLAPKLAGRSIWQQVIPVLGAALLLLLGIIIFGGFRTGGAKSKALFWPPWSWPGRVLFLLLCGVAVGMAFGALLSAKSVAGMAGEETWTLFDGVSIWATQIIRLAAVILSIGFLTVASWHFHAHRADLWERFFSVKKIPNRLLTPRAGLARSRIASWWIAFENTWINSWRLPSSVTTANTTQVIASRLFYDYLLRSRLRCRYLRVVPTTLLYFGGIALLAMGAGGIPDRLCIRGANSRWFDTCLLYASVFLFLVATFYVLDATRLTGRLLELLAQGRSRWPPWLLQKRASEKGLLPQDLDGWIDMQFAAEKTAETGRLMIYPALILALLLVSRSSIFEWWTWPGSLVFIFVLNFILTVVCWTLVRASARHVRAEALRRLDRTLRKIEATPRGALFSVLGAPGQAAGSAGSASAPILLSEETYTKRLANLRAEIEGERRGAFARLIQDPTCVALFLPSGITGILSLLLYYSLNRP